MYKPNKTFLISLFIYCVAVKVLPFVLLHFGMDIRSDSIYPWSFTPLFAFGIFGVAKFQNQKLAYALPVLAMVVGDLLIGAFTGLKYGEHEGIAYGIYAGQAVQYVALLACISCGYLARTSKWQSVLAASLIGPVLFYLISNLAVWHFDIGIGYPHTLAGLMQSYTAGLPFFRNQLLSTAAFSAILFSPLGMRNLSAPAKPTVAEEAAAQKSV